MGTRSFLYVFQAASKDHPHACGDKNLSVCFLKNGKGSSPRVWGQDLMTCQQKSTERIIPTRVGTRRYVQPTTANPEDHPHACGDKKYMSETGDERIGSSPRVWGQESYRYNVTSIHRIIPTRVGTSHSLFAVSHQRKDHPHACGDKTKEIKENSGFAKSTA